MILNLKSQCCGVPLYAPDWFGGIICSVCSQQHEPDGTIIIPKFEEGHLYSDRIRRAGIDTPGKGRE